MRDVLFITLKFPPNADIGAKRPLRMVRRLPRHGWRPTVLTLPVGEPGENDPALLDLVPGDLRIERTYAGGPVFRVIDGVKRAWARDVGRSLSGGRPAAPGRWTKARRALIYRAENVVQGLTVLDEWSLFLPRGTLQALRMLRGGRFEVVYVCGDPNSPYVAGWIASRRSGLPLVLDMRDPWTQDPTIKALKYAHTHRIEVEIERRIFRDAAAIVLNTRRARDRYLDFYPWLDAGKVHVIHNAFDEELVDDVEVEPDARFTIAHFGHYHRLRSARVFLDGLRLFMDGAGLGEEDVRFVNYGEFIPADLEYAGSIGLGNVVEVRPPMPFRGSPAALRRARVLLIEQRNPASVQIPGKLYDYFLASRPVLSLSLNPELVKLIEETRSGWSVDPEDPAAVAQALERARATDLGEWLKGLNREAMVPYSGEDTARRLAAILDGVARPAD